MSHKNACNNMGMEEVVTYDTRKCPACLQRSHEMLLRLILAGGGSG